MERVPAAQPKTSGLAIAAVVTGLLGCFSIVGLVLGIVALFRIRRTGDKGRGLAVGGIAAFAAWTTLFVALFSLDMLRFSLDTKTDRQTESPTWIPGALVPPSARAGQCLDLRGKALSADSVALPCNSPHDGQIVHIYDPPPGPYPGPQAFEAQAKNECRRAKTKMRLPLPSPPPYVTLEMIHGGEREWVAGFRQVFCYVQAREGKLNDSLLKN